jgi:uncharacterized protein
MQEPQDLTSRPASKPFPGFLQSVGLILFNFVLSVFVYAFIVIVTGGAKPGPAAVSVSYVVTMTATLYFAYSLCKAEFKEVFPATPFRYSALLTLPFVVLGIAVFLAQALNVVLRLIPMPKEAAEQFQSLGLSPVFVVLVVLVAPVLEEMLFRGVILRGLLGRYGAATAVAVDTLLFAFAHMNPWQFLPALLLGTLSAWLFVRARSIILCIFVHVMWNTFYSGVGFLARSYGRAAPDAPKHMQLFPWWLNLFGLLLVGVGGWQLIKRTRPPV